MRRVWYVVEDLGYDTPCWAWQGALCNGYGRTHRTGVGLQPAHRYFYEVHVGPIPDGLHIDHLCRVRHCVNPAHLEPVTLAENSRRGSAATLTHEEAKRLYGEREQMLQTPEHRGRFRGTLSRAAFEEVASRYGVSVRTVEDVWAGRRWKGVAA